MEEIYYIAYGSNLNKQQMKKRCPDAVVVEKAMLKGYRLDFSLYLTVNKDPEYKTPVVIWKISKEDEKALDYYEGVDRNLYRKEYIILNHKVCLIYIMNDIPGRKNAVPTDIYLKTCRIGYRDFGFDLDILMDAYNRVNNNN